MEIRGQTEIKGLNFDQGLNDYFNLMTTMGSVFVIQTAKAMGIIGAIEMKPMTVKDFAEKTKLQERPLKLVLDSLVQLGFLQNVKEMYLPGSVLKYLSGSYQNLGKEYWDHLPTLLKTGQPLVKMDHPEEAEAEYVRQVHSLDWMMKPAASYLAQLIFNHEKETNNLKHHHHILDVGCGSGVWSLAVLKQLTNGVSFLVDFPKITEIAKQNAMNQQLGDRIEVLSGNYHQLEIPKEIFDIALLGNVTHLETEISLKNLLAKTKQSLKAQGKIFILDVFHDQPDGKLSSSLYELGLALRTANSKLYNRNELVGYLMEAGFSNIEYHQIPVVPFTMGFIVANK